MLKKLLQKVWRFITQPASTYPYPNFAGEHVSEIVIDWDMSSSSNVSALKLWIEQENFKDHLLTPEYHESSVAQAYRHSVNLNCPRGK